MAETNTHPDYLDTQHTPRGGRKIDDGELKKTIASFLAPMNNETAFL